jgi:subtilisin family serine protease
MNDRAQVSCQWLLLAAIGIGLTACAAAPPSPGGEAAERTVQILVTVPQADSTAFSLVGNPESQYLRRRGYGSSPATDRTLSQIARDHRLRRVRGWRITSLNVYCEVFEVGSDRTLSEILNQLADDPRIEIVQLVNEFQTQSKSYDDPLFRLQTNLSQLGLATAHEHATGRGVSIAVVDSQVQLSHPEFRGRIEFDSDLIELRSNKKRPEIHGTAVAGVIASSANNSEGIIGIAPDAEIIALRACSAADPWASAARCTSFSLAFALELAIEREADIINLSLVGPSDPLLAALLDVAIARGVIIVAAAPNTEDIRQTFPASHPGVIVAHTDPLAAARGNQLAVAAPGREILTTVPNSAYAFFSGNSFAAAHVSGIAALLLEQAPAMNAAGIVDIMTETVQPSGRLVNACRAVGRLSGTTDCSEQGSRPNVAQSRSSD